MEPSVVSDSTNFDINRFSATRALTNMDKSDKYANWVARLETPAYFVYDVGCRTLLTKLDLRNSCNGYQKNLLVYHHIFAIME